MSLWEISSVEMDCVHPKVREYVMGRLNHKKPLHVDTKQKGCPDADVPDSHCAMYRHDFTGTVCARRSTCCRNNVHTEQHCGSRVVGWSHVSSHLFSDRGPGHMMRKIATNQITASDLNTFTITFPVNTRMMFVMSGDKLISMKETFGLCEGTAERHCYIRVRAT